MPYVYASSRELYTPEVKDGVPQSGCQVEIICTPWYIIVCEYILLSGYSLMPMQAGWGRMDTGVH